MQLKDIHGVDNKNIGSVIFAQSFFWVDSKTSVCPTKNVPNTQFFLTSEKNFVYTPIPIVVDNKLECDQLGMKCFEGVHNYKNIIGMMPVSEELTDISQDTILTGALDLYEKGFIYSDLR
jgi:hypothetical protein